MFGLWKHQYDALWIWAAAFPLVQAECLKVLSGLHQERCCTLIDSLIDGMYMANMLIIYVREDLFPFPARFVCSQVPRTEICQKSDIKFFTVAKPMSTAVMTPRRQERCLCLVEPASSARLIMLNHVNLFVISSTPFVDWSCQLFTTRQPWWSWHHKQRVRSMMRLFLFGTPTEGNLWWIGFTNSFSRYLDQAHAHGPLLITFELKRMHFLILSAQFPVNRQLGKSCCAGSCWFRREAVFSDLIISASNLLDPFAMPLVQFKDLRASAQSPNRQKSCARSRQDEYLAPTLASLRAQEVWNIIWFEHVCTRCRNALYSGNAEGAFFEFPMQAHLASLDLLKPNLQAFESCKKSF